MKYNTLTNVATAVVATVLAYSLPVMMIVLTYNTTV